MTKHGRNAYFDRHGRRQDFADVVRGLQQTSSDHHHLGELSGWENAIEGSHDEVRAAVLRTFATLSATLRRLEQKVELLEDYHAFLSPFETVGPVLEGAFLADCLQLGVTVGQYDEFLSRVRTIPCPA